MTNFDLLAETTICVDYDDTIAVRVFGTIVPALGVIEGLNRLRANGYKVVIHSSRSWEKFPDSEDRVNDMVAQLDSWKVPYDSVHSGRGKPIAAAYIDDKAIRFDNNWYAVVNSILDLK